MCPIDPGTLTAIVSDEKTKRARIYAKGFGEHDGVWVYERGVTKRSRNMIHTGPDRIIDFGVNIYPPYETQGEGVWKKVKGKVKKEI